MKTTIITIIFEERLIMKKSRKSWLLLGAALIAAAMWGSIIAAPVYADAGDELPVDPVPEAAVEEITPPPIEMPESAADTESASLPVVEVPDPIPASTQGDELETDNAPQANGSPETENTDEPAQEVASDPFFWDGIQYIGFSSGTSADSCPDWVSICNTGLTNPIQQAVDSAPAYATVFLEAAFYDHSVVVNTPELTLHTLSVGQKFNLNTYQWYDLWIDSGCATIQSLTLNVPLHNVIRVEAHDITVNNGVSIQSAIDLVSEGGTVQIGPGTYQPFTVQKNHITISGDTGDSSIPGAGKQAPLIENEVNGVIIQNVDGIVVQGLLIRNSGYAITILNSENTGIYNNTLQHNDVALFNDDTKR